MAKIRVHELAKELNLETKDLMGYRLNSGFCKKNKMILDYIFSFFYYIK